ncbi:hypothetical protein J2Z32_001784 [Paenibacillus turicensis]|uniref:Uncharacterized protein n=1 Tax=Paenibacillus turicensis TaxID=160487 RepID=A0ABS4FRF1_9BACL|nr:hypothetical protein [Paenibacillus turicensis]
MFILRMDYTNFSNSEPQQIRPSLHLNNLNTNRLTLIPLTLEITKSLLSGKSLRL